MKILLFAWWVPRHSYCSIYTKLHLNIFEIFIRKWAANESLFSNLFNRATPELIADSLREHSRAVKQAQVMSNRAQMEGEAAGQQAMMQQAAAAQEQQGAQLESEVAMKGMDHDMEMEKIALKEAAKTERDMLKKQGM